MGSKRKVADNEESDSEALGERSKGILEMARGLFRRGASGENVDVRPTTIGRPISIIQLIISGFRPQEPWNLNDLRVPNFNQIVVLGA